jgi:hypothetical protein
MSHDEKLDEAVDYFSKTLFVISLCRIAENNDSRDLLPRSHMHVDE